MLEKYSNLSAYVARGEARPACQRAFADQLAGFIGNPPTGCHKSAVAVCERKAAKLPVTDD